MPDDINVSDGGAIAPIVHTPEELLEARMTTAGFSDIWNLIANLLKYDLFTHATKIVDMLFIKPADYKVSELIQAVKDAAAAIFGSKQAGPPMLHAPTLDAAFALDVQNKAAGRKYSIDEVRQELKKRGYTKISLPVIMGIISLLAQYGPGLWTLIDGWFKNPASLKIVQNLAE